ncbi:Phage integrase family protein [Halobacillus karajensis]|uniref:Uncharacterized protein n=1 Tax=Halobacillus karajensis TaxID=195088 RepID=A0A024P3W0_9BACI|nr:hypothetical protein [Halobacillus karajensis]CDQ20836.1 hypothetical protein BN982_03191 [Halobacillus karajensis]CDQ23694.1 hypothetical protein BN983_01945 [Halobacillus karajensis]CDQ27172.1 hypothetical protein BN981_01426 [Halobacillus karajensis]SEI03859.1 Phage integrase family protein [Halobacillus karajensis]
MLPICLNNGAPIEVIQSLLGYEKSETTKIYAQLIGKLILSNGVRENGETPVG